MLRNLGIRSKILAVLAVPVVVLVLAATIIAGGAVAEARDASQVERLAAQAPGLSLLVRGLQGERSLSLAVLAGDEQARPQLAQVRAKVDEGLGSVRAQLGSVDLTRLDDAAQDAVAASTSAHSQLASIRGQVDAGAMSAEFAAKSYANVIDADVALPERIADAVEDRDLSRQLRAYSAAERLAEAIAREIDLGSAGIAGGFPPELLAQLSVVVDEQDTLRATASAAADRLGVRVPARGDALARAREQVAAGANGITAEQWRSAGSAEIDALDGTLTSLANMAGNRSAELARDAASRALQVALSVVALVVLTVLLALFTARRITEPLHRLTEAAAQIRSELPRMVEQMQTPGEGPDVTLPDIPVESGDEVGRLAAAFNDVNRATIEVAHEQAALRGSIAAMFVNVARRDQVLLSRQLAFIDQLERAEEDPKTLENLFRLDHLATRMRRNAESLLVLAGIDTGRRLRRPMLLSDVVRTAFSEIEHYDRVELSLRVDPPVVGHVALSAAHLVAELLENATRFSDPGSRVLVSTGTGCRGVVVTITDEGLGMTPEEIADANARIAEPPIAEVVGAQRLGFFVVGRLARKLDATVTLKPGATKGTVATIELGPALFVAGSVPELPAMDVVEVDVVEADVVQVDVVDADDVPSLEPASSPESSVEAPRALERQERSALSKQKAGSALPKRTPGATKAAAAVSTGATAPAATGTAEPRSAGLFSGFRARRADAETAARGDVVAAPAAAQGVERVPAAGLEPTSVETAQVEEHHRPAVGTPALTILPDVRGGRGRRSRGGRAQAEPVQPMTHRELRRLEHDDSDGSWAEHAPVPHRTEPADTPTSVVTGSDSAPAARPMDPAGPSSSSFAPQVTPDGRSLPTRSGAGHQRSGVVTGGVRERSALASEALNELSLLSAYSPSSVESKPASTLTRRTPAETPPAAVPAARPVAPARRSRNASDVRSMLSGFQAGVERGRTAGEPGVRPDGDDHDGTTSN